MPTGKEAREYWIRLVELETKVEGLVTYQKWQMGLLALIFMAALKAAIH